ncbi:Metallothionein expression activator, partial [Irineochytrium annulatum]
MDEGVLRAIRPLMEAAGVAGRTPPASEEPGSPLGVRRSGRVRKRNGRYDEEEGLTGLPETPEDDGDRAKSKRLKTVAPVVEPYSQRKGKAKLGRGRKVGKGKRRQEQEVDIKADTGYENEEDVAEEPEVETERESELERGQSVETTYADMVPEAELDGVSLDNTYEDEGDVDEGSELDGSMQGLHQDTVDRVRNVRAYNRTNNFSRSDNPAQLLCELCGRGPYVTTGGWRAHMKLHNASREFVCKVCKKTYLRKQDLLRHEFSHSSVKPFNCVCGASFARGDAYKRHTRAKMCQAKAQRVSSKSKEPESGSGFGASEEEADGEDAEEPANSEP